MSREDAILSIQRHTTSKINTYNDLHNIQTLGFRGEALASIASVSRLELKTMMNDKVEGTMLKIDGGIIEDVGKSGGVRGTSITIKNLFYNTPARRKFLKRDETEYRNILNIVNRFTLAYSQIKFSLFNKDNKIYEYKPTYPKERIIEVLGNRYKENILELNNDPGLISIAGYIGNQDAVKKSRGDQYLFLNGRYIVNRALNHAIISAYGTIIPRGEFPLYVIFLNIEPRRVDVNVHPSKIEVKFADERLIYDLLRRTVKAALNTDQVIPEISSYKSRKAKYSPASTGIQTQMPLNEFQRKQPYKYDDLFHPNVRPETIPKVITTQKRTVSKIKHRHSDYDRINVWQIHNKYIISEIKSGFIIIDQHVAHERVLYERALKSFEAGKPSSQQLLFPQVIELTPEDYSNIKEILPLLEKIGFIIKGFGSNTIVIEGVPADLKISSNEKLLTEIFEYYRNNMNNNLDIRDNVAKSFSCKSAIKAGEKLTLEEMNALIDQLFATQSPYFCPHGRPVIINIPLEELDKRFGRI